MSVPSAQITANPLTLVAPAGSWSLAYVDQLCAARGCDEFARCRIWSKERAPRLLVHLCDQHADELRRTGRVLLEEVWKEEL